MLSYSKQNMVASGVLFVGLSLILNASYIQLKAQLAQVLIASAYVKHQMSSVKQTHKPWPWADTHVIAKLKISGQSSYVLANASMRNLAFGPALMSQTATLGSKGNSVIIGHRDTHFSHLQHIKIGEVIMVYQANKEFAYKVEEIVVVDESDISVIDDLPYGTLTLITCYPFNSIDPNPKQRFVIRASKIVDIVS